MTQGLSPEDIREAMELARDRFGSEAVLAREPDNPLVPRPPRRRRRAFGDITTKTLPSISRESSAMIGDLDDGFIEGELLAEEPGGPPFPLNVDSLERLVPPSSPGVFVVSHDRTMDARIGRADSDLRLAIGEFVGDYAYFHFETIVPRKERFERECELYHRLGGDRGQLDNEEHPLPPPGPQLKCPVCVKSNA